MHLKYSEVFYIPFTSIHGFFQIYFQAFIDEAESLLNSSSMAFDKFDFNKSTGHTPSVIGAQEVYRYIFIPIGTFQAKNTQPFTTDLHSKHFT
jgi:hypothetical protein